MPGKMGGQKLLVENRKARHDYFIEEVFEAGIELFGTEVKSLRNGGAAMKDCYCTVKDGELILRGMHISPYEKGNIFNREPERDRRLLMHKREIARLYGRVKLEGYALIPLKLYLRNGWVKVELALAKGKKNYDKREATAGRDAGREMDRAFKGREY